MSKELHEHLHETEKMLRVLVTAVNELLESITNKIEMEELNDEDMPSWTELIKRVEPQIINDKVNGLYFALVEMVKRRVQQDYSGNESERNE